MSTHLPNEEFNHPTWQAWLVCICGALYFFYEFAQMNMFNAIEEPLMSSYGLDSWGVGNLSAYYFYANVTLLLPAGIIIDRVSTRKLLLFIMSFTLCALIGFTYAPNLTVLKITRAMMGAASSFCFLANIRLASRWFPAHKMALVIGVIITIAMLGGFSVQTPLTYFTAQVGWRHALITYMGGMGLVILTLIFLFVKDQPSDSHQFEDNQKELESSGLLQALAKVLTNKQNWLAGLYTGLLNLPIILIGAMWGISYFNHVFGLTRVEASSITGMIFIGTIIGSPIFGGLSDAMKKRKPLMIICSVASLAAILAAMYIPNLTYWPLMGLYLLVGFFTSAQILSYPVIAESNPNAVTATAEGLASTMIQAGGLAQPVFGWIMGLHLGQAIAKTSTYTAIDYQNAMLLLPAGCILAILISFLIRETNAVSFEDAHQK